MSDSKRNWAAVNNQANTCHEEVLNLFADLALDDGDEDLAASYRWMALNRKWPVQKYNGLYCMWLGRADDNSWLVPVGTTDETVENEELHSVISGVANLIKTWLIAQREK